MSQALVRMVLGACLALPSLAFAAVSHLQVEYRDQPLGIDVQTPHFSWQSEAPANVRGFAQSAYQIQVRDSSGRTVWDSGKVQDAHSVAVAYAGSTLQPETRYEWTVTVWDAQSKSSAAQSAFETGVMGQWDGAAWVGGADESLVLYSQYLPLFDLDCTVTIAPGSQRAALVLAANDPRLMDRNKNIYQLENGPNQSYFKVELDVSAEPARLNVYRVGYAKTDDAAKPFKSFPIRNEVINARNKHAAHRISIRGEYGELGFLIDNVDEFSVSQESKEPPPPPWLAKPARSLRVNLNPAGKGHDYLTYGYLSDIGFAVDAGQTASFSDLTVSNTRKPAHVLFHEDLTHAPEQSIYKRFTDSGLRIVKGAYAVSGRKQGAFIVADPSRNSMPMLRTAFETQAKKIKAARLYVTARGIYEIYLNGRRVGEDYYNPGLTQYNVTHLYQTYDVTNLLAPGKNALGAMLGEGWWSGLLSFGNNWNYFGDRQSLLAKLVLQYEDGTREVLATHDRTWKTFQGGPVVFSSLLMGEVYDATREAAVNGWSTAAYDDRAWLPAVNVSLQNTAFPDLQYDHLSLVGQIGEPAKIYKVLTARSVKEVRKGVYVYDMGQNLVGVPRIRIAQGRPGQRVTFRTAEMLYPDLPASAGNVGMIMTENYRAALSQDQYVMKAGAQVFQPRFTSHGYQYLEITGLDEPLPLSQVEGVAISSIHELTASYESSNAKVNQLWSNLVWSNVDNFLTLPTDCPQRNERMGWSGDLSVFSRTATYVSNAGPFLERHMRAMRDSQLPSGKFTDIAPLGGGFGGVLWGSAGITVPWEAYQQYGDVALLRDHYAAMAAYMDYLATTLDPETGLSRDAQLGDWLGPQNDQLGPAFLVTAYHVYDLEIMTRVAEILGNKADAAKFRNMTEERKRFFNKTFVNASGQTLGLLGAPGFRSGPSQSKGEFKVADVQSAYAVGLALGVFNSESVPAMGQRLAATVERENADDQGVVHPPHSLMTGFIGTAWISKALSDAGRSDLAYRQLQNVQYPSWLYPIEQGATTIWERLNGYTVEKGFGGNNSMNSFNHYSFGAVGQWLMAYSLGIQRGEPGFKSFVLQPEPDPTGQMTWAKGHYDSPYGRIESAWRVEDKTLTYEATVPPNTSATLYLPTRSAQGVRETGQPAGKARGLKLVRYENGKAIYQLGSGAYHFTAPL